MNLAKAENKIKDIANELAQKFNVEDIKVYYDLTIDSYYIQILDKNFKPDNNFLEFRDSEILEFTNKFEFTCVYFTWEGYDLVPSGKLLYSTSAETELL